jgi:hypothetical protein
MTSARVAASRPDRLSVVLVGNAATFSAQLRGVGFGTFETVELGDLDLIAANFKRAPTRAGRAGGAGRTALLKPVAAYQQAPAAQPVTPVTAKKAKASLSTRDWRRAASSQLRAENHRRDRRVTRIGRRNPDGCRRRPTNHSVPARIETRIAAA